MKKHINKPIKCLVCDNNSRIHDVVDFNKCCEEYRGKYLNLSGIPIYYYLCENCNFCFAPEFQKWSFKDFQENIYNDSYIEVDPDFLEIRPYENAELINKTFFKYKKSIKHLDYVGGNNRLSNHLNNKGWNSSSYNPFVDIDIKNLGKFDLITAFEIFEHISNIDELMHNLSTLIKEDGIIIFSTNLSDNEIKKNKRITWWYASPRNGNISLFSSKSLKILAEKYNFKFKTLEKFHIFYKKTPFWFELFQDSGNNDFALNLNKMYIQLKNLKNKKIVLYGAGKVSSLLLKILNTNNIISIIDKNINSDFIKDFEIKKPNSLSNLDYDFIIITVLGRESTIFNYLHTELNISSNKIIPLNLTNNETNFKFHFAQKVNYFFNFIENFNFYYDKIVLYGTGKIATILVKMYPCNIVAIIDENPKNAFIKDFTIDCPSNLEKIQYDIILITILDKEKQISTNLVEKYNISSNKIATFDITRNFNDEKSYFSSLERKVYLKKMNCNLYSPPYKLVKDMRVLNLISFFGIGDYLFVTPVIKLIKDKFPYIKIIAYVSKNSDTFNSPLVFQLLERDVNIDKVKYYNGKPGLRWEEYDISNAVEDIHKMGYSDDTIFPLIFEHDNINSKHRTFEVMKSFSLEYNESCLPPKPLLFINKNDKIKNLKTINFINNLNKKVIFLHLEARSTKYSYPYYNKLIELLIEKNYFVVLIADDYINNIFSKDNFFYLNVKENTLYESFALIDEIKIEKYFIAVNSVMLHVSSALDIPALGLFIAVDSTQTRQTYYNNIKVLTVDKNCHEFLGKNNSFLIKKEDVEIKDTWLITYPPEIIVKNFENSFSH